MRSTTSSAQSLQIVIIFACCNHVCQCYRYADFPHVPDVRLHCGSQAINTPVFYATALRSNACHVNTNDYSRKRVFSLTCPCGETMLVKTLCARSHYCVLHRTHCANAAKLHSPKVSNMSALTDVAPSLRGILHGIKPDERVVSKQTAGRT